MEKKANPPGKNQRQRMKAKKLREEAAMLLDEENKPIQKVCEDEKGRKLTVIIGGETEMDKLWDRLTMAQALQTHLDDLNSQTAALILSLYHIKTAIVQQVKIEFEQMNNDLSALIARIKDAMLENNEAEVAEHGIHVSDLVPNYSSPAGIADIEKAITGFEEEISKALGKIEELQRRVDQ
ncbi:hypothetical protein LZ30DRAFT_822176 [Colletotrichum cereale]|nr:hypothetical protein LZ30DRAFT_822176 [Colletotrichum cereale]